MATFDQMFGKKSSTGGFIKWDQVGVTLIFEVTDEPTIDHPQKNFKTGKNKWLVQEHTGGKWTPMDEGSFDESDVVNSFQLFQIAIPVRVVERKNPDGTKDESFEPFESLWELNQDQEGKLKEKMLETELPVEKGTQIAVKYLLDGKPRKYAIGLKAAQ